MSIGFRFSVGSIHWCCCLVVVVLRSYGDDGPLGPSTFTPAAPKDAAPTAVAPSSDLAQQLQPMTRDLAAVSQAVEQLKVRQEQLVRDNENVASQLKASQEEMARNNSIIDQIKATQIQMARQSQTLTERLNASQEQLARVIANASEPKVTPEEPKVSPEERKVMPEIPLPRPRQLANVAQTLPPTLHSAAASQKTATVVGVAMVSALVTLPTCSVTYSGSGLGGKRLELLLEAITGTTKIAVFWNPSFPGHADALENIRTSALARGIEVFSRELKGIEDLELAFDDAIHAKAQAAVFMADNVMFGNRKRVRQDLRLNSRLPTIHSFPSEVGGWRPVFLWAQ